MSRLPATIVIFAGFFLIGKLFLLWGILLPDIAADLQMSEVVSGALFFALLCRHDVRRCDWWQVCQSL